VILNSLCDCLAGLSRTSNEAQILLLYFFYGTYFWATKVKKKGATKGDKRQTVFREKDIVFYLHKKLINGRSRHAKNVHVYFAKFIAAFEKNKDWAEFLMDGGTGSPPVEFNMLVEDGLRVSARGDIFIMGANALRCDTNTVICLQS
jgi:hypothetical protein